MKYYIYLVRCKDNSLYCGITTDVARRIEEHNTDSRAAKYTRSRRPVMLVYVEEVNSREDALKREYSIKKLPRLKKEQLLKATGV